MKSQSKPDSQDAAAAQDEELIRGCLNGDQNAWSDLLDRYKALIYSVPVKRGLPPDGAADVFQEVCMTLLAELPNLREHRALAAWLIRTAVHKCMHWERARRRYVGPDGLDDVARWEDPQDAAGQMTAEFRREHLLRETLAEMPER